MPYAVVLYFDDDSTEKLKAVWRRQAENDISAFMLEEGYRPHITLGGCEGLDIESCRSALKRFSAETTPFPVRMPYVGIFPHDRGAIFLGVAVTDALLAYHKSFYDQFGARAEHVYGFSTPGLWVPHCTLAHHESREKDLAALAINLDLPLPITATCVSLAVIEFPPWKERLSFPLGG